MYQSRLVKSLRLGAELEYRSVSFYFFPPKSIQINSEIDKERTFTGTNVTFLSIGFKSEEFTSIRYRVY